VEAAPDAVVHLGFSRDVAADELAAWVAGQRIDEMLAATNRIPVAAGDTVLCPAGVPHAIGAGILLVEIQEPTDFSILLEWGGFDLDGPAVGHLGLGYDLALACVDRTRGDLRPDASTRSVGPGVERLFPHAADEFFVGERLRPDPTSRLAPAFSIVVVTTGSGTLETTDGRLPVRRGDTILIPYAAGESELTGDVEAIRLRAPTRP
jgi:mannose-6-phosphate isomerase